MGQAMRKLILALILLLGVGALFAFGYLRSVEPRATVTDARIRLPAAPGVPGAGYFKVALTSNQETLTGVTSPAAARIEMHLTREENGVSRMEAVPEVSSHRAYELEFAPGGHHLMLFGLDPALRPGATIPLTLTFLKSPPVTVEARLEAPGGSNAHAGH
jgi:copper(I)-binding protein